MRAPATTMTAAAFRFPGSARSIADARARVGGILAGTPFAADAVLVLSELATNAVRHTESGIDGGEYVVAVEESHDRIVIHVADMGGVLTTHIPPPVRPADAIPAWQIGGRGRALVAAYAHSVNFGASPCTGVHDDLGGLCCRAAFYYGSQR